MRYFVTIEVTNQHLVEVDAESEDEARKIALDHVATAPRTTFQCHLGRDVVEVEQR